MMEYDMKFSTQIMCGVIRNEKSELIMHGII